MDKGEQRFHKKEIARKQLETATALFLNNVDDASVITLAGAASNILTQLLFNEGKEPFIDLARRVHHKLSGRTPPRVKYNHYINKRLGIIALKHMSDTCPDKIELDLHECAFQALGRAIGDYSNLFGQTEPFIVGFLNWAWVNKDGPKIMEQFSKLPDTWKK